MRPILAGIETEYGLAVEGGGAEDQLEEARTFVRCYEGVAFAGWDTRKETPRNDLRGFRADRLAVDPEDRQFDRPGPARETEDLRSDRVLSNGARFYNDHGHPEYATPECATLDEIAEFDKFGESILYQTACNYTTRTGRTARIYKNNTDFQGASYGTHENYLIPRNLNLQTYQDAVIPVLIARTALCGAGKVGSESGTSCAYQLSQRADFLTELASVDTLYRRPIFNTRDEPHTDPRLWRRLHVIAGDANRIPAATARKIGLIKLALHLAEADAAPRWEFEDPVRAFHTLSRNSEGGFELRLQGGHTTTALEVLESYYAAAEARLDLTEELCALIAECRTLGNVLSTHAPGPLPIDWVAKKRLLEMALEERGTDWDDPALASYDLEYHRVDPAESLYDALIEIGEIPKENLSVSKERTRAFARGLAIQKFSDALATLSWGSLVFKTERGHEEVPLPPDLEYPMELEHAPDVETFIRILRRNIP